MPFAGYKDFAACVAANQDKANPEAYCGKIKHAVEKVVDPDHPLVKHHGPGDHPNGTPQSVHGLRSGFPNLDIEMSMSQVDSAGSPVVHLDKIVVPENERGQGQGSAFMMRMIEWADENGVVLATTPDPVYGGDPVRLEEFYSRFGFVRNTGRNADYAVSGALIREIGTPVYKHYPGGEDHDQRKHGRRGGTTRGSWWSDFSERVDRQRLSALIEENNGLVYVRYSKGPETDRGSWSYDYAAGQPHAEGTLSVNNLVPQDEKTEYDDWGYFESVEWVPNWPLYESLGGVDWAVERIGEYRHIVGVRPWLMKAKRVGTDSDGGPLIDSDSFEFLGWADELLIAKHYPGGEDHDQKRHGRRGPNAQIATVPAFDGGRLEIATDEDLDTIPPPEHNDPFAGAREDPETGALILNNGIRVTSGGMKLPRRRRWGGTELVEFGEPEGPPDDFHRQLIQDLEKTAPGLLDAAALKDVQRPDMTIRFTDERFPQPLDPDTLGLHDPDTNELWITTVRRDPLTQWSEPRDPDEIVETMIHEIAHKIDDRYGTGTLESVELGLGYQYAQIADQMYASGVTSQYDAFNQLQDRFGEDVLEEFSYPMITAGADKFHGEMFAEAVRTYYTNRPVLQSLDQQLGSDIEGYVEQVLARTGADQPVYQPPLYKTAPDHTPEEYFALLDWYHEVTGVLLPTEGMPPSEAFKIADRLWEQIGDNEPGEVDPDFELEKHYGPGDHPSGSSQQAHAGGGIAVAEDTSRTMYSPPIDHQHSLGEKTPELERVLTTGAPIRQRFKQRLDRLEGERETLRVEYEELNKEWSKLVDLEVPLRRRQIKTIEKIAQIEAGRYMGPSMEPSITAHLMDPTNGDTITARLESWRKTATQAKPTVIELTKAQDAELSDIEVTGYDDIVDIHGEYELKTLRTKTGNVKGGQLILHTEEAQQVWAARLETMQWRYSGWGGGVGATARMLATVKNKVASAPPPQLGGSAPQETWWKVWMEPGSAYKWDSPLGSVSGNIYDKANDTFMAVEMMENFLGPASRWEPVAGDRLLGRYADSFTYKRVGTRSDSDRYYQAVSYEGAAEAPPEQIQGVRVVSSTALVDRLLVDADWAHTEYRKIAPDINRIQEAYQANTQKRLHQHRNAIGEFLESEGIPTGSQIKVPSRRGVAGTLAVDSTYLPALWVDQYNEYISRPEVKFSVQKKKWGGHYRDSRNWLAGRTEIQIRTNGSTSTNIHELGHGFEAGVPGMRNAVKDFFNYRTNNGQIRSRRVTNARQYADSFTDPYSGKAYDWGDHEILSNGLGDLYGGGRNPPDDEHLDWLFGLMKLTAVEGRLGTAHRYQQGYGKYDRGGF